MKSSIKGSRTKHASVGRRVTGLQSVLNSLDSKPFTDDDFLIIDFVNDDESRPFGGFANKIKGRYACWVLEYSIRTIPSVYFSTNELAAETIAAAHTDFDEYELTYIHQSFCSYTELNRIIKDILINFLDPMTHLIAAQVKVRPMELHIFLAKYGTFTQPLAQGDNYEINYWYHPGRYDNWDFDRRPLTSTPVPL